MISSMIGYKHLLQLIALCNADGDAQHDAITERNHRGFHIVISIMPFWNSIGSFKETALEILVHKAQIDSNMLDAETLTMHFGKGNLTLIMIGTIIETDTQSDFVLLVVEQRNTVHTTAHNNH